MLRKLNFTERHRIPRAAVQIVLRREDGALAFDATLALRELPLPGEARVFVEAYYRSSYMRFDFGTVANLREPEDRRLVAIDSANVVRFRVKVVGQGDDEGRILGLADGITVSDRDAGGARVSLLPVAFDDLGEEAWRIDFDPAGGPVLEVNNRIDGIEQMVRSDPRFFALVYPAAIRRILHEALFVEEIDPSDGGDEWGALWLQWATRLAGAPPEDDPYARRSWIDEVAAAFCAERRAATRLGQSGGADDE